MSDKAKSDWYPFSRDLAEGCDFDPWNQRAFLHLSERLVGIFNAEISEMHFVLWEEQDGDDEKGPYHIAICAFGSDGYASKIKLGEWIKASIESDQSGSWYGKNKALKTALSALRADIDTAIAGLDAEPEPKP